jgi:hypothetical protein
MLRHLQRYTGKEFIRSYMHCRFFYVQIKAHATSPPSCRRSSKATHVALCKVPYDQLDPQVKLTLGKRSSGGHLRYLPRRLVETMGKMFSLSSLMARHDIAGAIDDIKKQVDDMAKRRGRYQLV